MPFGDVAQDICMRDDNDLPFRAGTQPAADPAGTLLQGGSGGGVESLLRCPVGRKLAEVEPSVLWIGFEFLSWLGGN